jgi:hypothetical protein
MRKASIGNVGSRQAEHFQLRQTGDASQASVVDARAGQAESI